MPADALLALQTETTKTATFNGDGKDMKNGIGSDHGLFAAFIYSAAANASGSNTATFSIEHSDALASGYTTHQTAADVTLSTTAQANKISLPLSGTKRYVRASVTIAGAGTSPTITYSCYVEAGKP